MRTKVMSLLILASMIIAGPAIAQDDNVKLVYGSVESVSGNVLNLIIEDEQGEATSELIMLKVDENTEYENIDGIGDLSAGDNLEIIYSHEMEGNIVLTIFSFEVVEEVQDDLGDALSDLSDLNMEYSEKE